MKLAVAKRKFRGNWLAFQFKAGSENEGTVVCHDRDAHKLHGKLKSRRSKAGHVYITFAGPKLPKEAAIIFVIH